MTIILNDRDQALQVATYRSKDTLVTITSTSGAFKTPKNGGITTPASITLTSTPNNVFTSAAIYTWHYALSATPTVWILLGTGITKSILNTDILSVIGESTQVNYRCTTTETLLDTAYGFYTVYYSKDLSDPIVVEMSRSTATIACDSAGVPIGYTNTDTTIKVSRGGVYLNYNTGQINLAAANTFSVSILSNANLTLTTALTSGITYTLPGITNIANLIDVAKIVYTVIVYDAAGVATPSLTKEIVYNKISNGFVGKDAVVSYIEVTAPLIFKSTSSSVIAGTHTNITATGKITTASTTVTGGYITITGDGDAEQALATPNTITTNISNSAGKKYYTINMYSKSDKLASGGVLLDSEEIPVVFNGDSAVTMLLTNDSHNIPTNAAGLLGIYDNSGTNIYAYEGSKALLYDGVGTDNGTWKVDLAPGSTTASNITIGIPIADGGEYAIVPNHINLTADTASIKYVIVGKTYGGTSFTLSKLQTFAKAVKGETGLSGTKSITINAYRWGKLGIGNISKSFTYTWGSAVTQYPTETDTTWSGSAGAAPGSGYTLYQISLTITDIASATTTLVDWSNAVSNQLGYRLDGVIGLTGNSARVAYRVLLTSSGVPGKPGDSVGDTMPNADWSATSTSTLTEGYSMYQTDGILSGVGTATIKVVWGNPYLSNLKVGSLSALTANLGTVNISTVGSLSNTRTYGAATAGFFLGYDSTAYKFEVTDGVSTGNYLRWNGTNLSLNGAVYATSGTIGGNVIDSNGIHSPGYSKNGDVINGWMLDSAGNLFAKSGTFGGSLKGSDITGASGNFSGGLSGSTIDGVTGTFSGKLSAGTVDFSSSVGTTVVYPNTGDYTLIVPTGCTKMRLTLVGGGGGGDGGSDRWTGSGGGGRGGSVAVQLFDVYPGQQFGLRVAGGGVGATGWYDRDYNTNVFGHYGGYPTPGGTTVVWGMLQAVGGAVGASLVRVYDINESMVYDGERGYPAGFPGSYGGAGAPSRSYQKGSNGVLGGGGGGGYGVPGTDPNWLPLYGAGDGGGGWARVEYFDPNGVVLKADFEALKDKLRSWGIA